MNYVYDRTRNGRSLRVVHNLHVFYPQYSMPARAYLSVCLSVPSRSFIETVKRIELIITLELFALAEYFVAEL